MIKLNNLSLLNSIVFAVISGAMIIPLSYLDSFGKHLIFGASIIDVLIGAVFALLVMIPLQKNIKWLRSILMILASIVIYVGMAHLVVNFYHGLFLDFSYAVSVTISGGLGAILTGVVVQLLAPLKLNKLNYVWLMSLGLIAGYIFSITINSSHVFINALGFIVWQVAVSYSLYMAKK
ncbi:MAG: hypothetical protein L3J83_09135 [Proteobacteria bacterium]|nr:hypothetical protein [Pseudomonadota bacterium]